MKKSTQELFDLMKKTQAFDTYMEITKEERVETTVSAALEKLLEEKTSIKANVLRPPAWTGPMPTRFFQESRRHPAINCWHSAWVWDSRWRKPRRC